MSLRLIAGEKGGLTLQAPKGLATRPTQGRVRESLFMILMDRLSGARALDLFAGAGTLGLEALSRGAEHATFVESARPAIEALRVNIDKTGWRERAEIVPRDALAWLGRATPAGGGRPYDLILLDPPYGHGFCDRAMTLLAKRREVWLAEGGLIAAQFERRDPMQTAYEGLIESDRRNYSETVIAFFSRASLI